MPLDKGIRRLAIVPARGGSKRIPNKNTRDFCGAPMITHILKTASNSNLFTKIHVSTESAIVQSVVAEHDFSPDFPRPTDLADDHTPIMPVLRFVTGEYQSRGEAFDEIWLLMACAPLVESSDLLSAAELFQAHNKQHQVLAVGEYQTPIERAFIRANSGILNPINPDKLISRSQDLKPHYFDAGAFSVYSSTQILEPDRFNPDQEIVGYLLPKNRAVDIDDEDDWRLAESFYLAKN